MNYKPYKHLPPFKGMVLQNFPFIEEDFDAITNYQLLCKVVEYLKNVIANELVMEENVTNLYNSFVELKNYVDNYFKNLDVQEEINNKLDEMVEDGTLQEIISSYLNANALWCFDNIEDMKNATNLINGSYAKTLGYYEVNDGGGSFYHIRNKTNNDIEDDATIIFINNELVAELQILNDTINVKQFGAKGNDTDDDTIAIQKAINYGTKNVFIPNGTYLVSTIIINRTLKLYGNSNRLTIIKSINNNGFDAVLQVFNNGLNYSDISNIYINGNRTNNSERKVHGIMLWCNDQNADRYTYLHDLVIRFCSGNGLYLGTDSGSTNMKEQRFYNIEVGNNDENGVYVKNATDGYFSQITSHRNIKSGFLITGGNHKIINCKAFWNGEGTSEELETVRRIPSSAFTVTADTTYNPNKTYYTRTGENIQNNWYEFVEFSGNAFVDGTTYYELTTFYQKRYAGFTLEGATRCVVTACESQENFGDGFYTYTNNVNLVSILSDSNGLLIDENNNMISYESVNKTQLYCGLYIYSGRCINVIGDMVNSRISQVGKYQLAPLYIRGCNNVSFKITSDEMVNEFVMFQKCNMNTSNGTCNNQEVIYEYDISSIGFLDSNIHFYNNSDYKSYIKKIGSKVYFRFIINDDNGNILTNDNSKTLFYLNQILRPKENIFFLAYLTNNEGNTIAGIANAFISKAGTFAIRSIDRPSTNVKGIYVEGSYVIGN